jgi:outer membrane protein
MKRFCLKVFGHYLFALCLLSFALISQAGSKVGYVQMKVIMQSPQSINVGKKLMAEFTPRNAELEKFRKQIQDKEVAFNKEASNLSQKDLLTKRQEIEYLKIDFDRKKNRQHEDFQIRKQEELNAFQNNVNLAVTTLGQTEDYDLILYNTGGYIGPKVDITDKVLKLLKQ